MSVANEVRELVKHLEDRLHGAGMVNEAQAEHISGRVSRRAS